MASRYELEVTITSATHLKNVNWRHGSLKPYAVVWIDPNNKCSTRVDEEGDESPHWDQKLVIPFNSPIEDSTLHIDVVHAAKPSDDGTKPLIGSAKLRLRDVVDSAGFGGSLQKKLELKRPSGRPHGKIEIQAAVREPNKYRAPDPYNAPPYGVSSRDYNAAPPPPAYGNVYAPPAYGAPPPPYYGAPPPQAGYPYGGPGYGQPAAGYGGYGQAHGGYGGGYGEYKEEKKSKFGGMGTGLAVGAVAGVLGGLAIAEGVDYVEDKIADDVAEKVEDDLAYDDYGGDDF